MSVQQYLKFIYWGEINNRLWQWIPIIYYSYCYCVCSSFFESLSNTYVTQSNTTVTRGPFVFDVADLASCLSLSWYGTEMLNVDGTILVALRCNLPIFWLSSIWDGSHHRGIVAFHDWSNKCCIQLYHHIIIHRLYTINQFIHDYEKNWEEI